jgi:RNA polymerase sigma-70 factor (ECF subfamily)
VSGQAENKDSRLQDDGELVNRCLGGEEDAWEALVRRYHRRVWNIAYHFVGRAAEADELTQEIFVRVFQGLESFDTGGSFAAWITRVARNHCIDHYRRRRLEKAITTEERGEASVPEAPRATDPYVALEHKDLAAWIRTALDHLPDELKQAVVLRDLQEMSYDDMAELLDVPLGTVKSRINRGRLELARLLTLRRHEWTGSREQG